MPSVQDYASGTQKYSTKAEKPIRNLEILQQPWSRGTLVQVRTGKVKPLYSLSVQSAIYKNPRNEGVHITFLGCEGDEQAYEFHGGPDKAIHHYSSQHYESWMVEFPQSKHRFNIGGFGENFVSSLANERNLCIGDVINIGPEVVVQVSLPRQPCFKLNHRFEVKDMSRQSQEKSRTGWYYRVLKEGFVRPGDEMVLVKRINPLWTIADVQHFLYRDMRNTAAMEELVEIEGLGQESRDIFSNRLKRNFENQDERLEGDDSMALSTWSDYRLAVKRKETSRITAFVFEVVTPFETVKPVLPGSHVRLKLGGKLVRPYSVIGGSNNRFELGVALDVNSRGGSEYLHNIAKEGEIFSVGEITPSFPLAKDADHQVLIAGGIGITAFIATARYLQEAGQPYKLHFAARSAADVPFKSYLEDLGVNIIIHDKSVGNAINIKQIISKTNDNTHIYCCGPERLMAAVVTAADEFNLPKDHVHFEAFAVNTSGDPFTVECKISEKTLEVPGERTLLDVLRDTGMDVASSCEAGSCGTCIINVVKGRIEHRGTGLLDEDKESGMLCCVSRGIGHIVIDL